MLPSELFARLSENITEAAALVNRLHDRQATIEDFDQMEKLTRDTYAAAVTLQGMAHGVPQPKVGE